MKFPKKNLKSMEATLSRLEAFVENTSSPL
jgi:hypothetical protein